ncbi:defensin Ec-AMP-D1-like [Rosa rugosa]|uniref:defensin Ec-AMP-D1-like n=1 Tax=Rosa rugosa TaxID=74645 RepID=UPI002B406D2E|nr:defensin Ec-AMP-D1-like [Rosa rugosa]
MANSMRLFSSTFIPILLLVAIEMAPRVAEGKSTAADIKPRTCESLSHKFKGMCISSSNCATMCKSEGFLGGKCQGFRMRCYCTKQC